MPAPHEIMQINDLSRRLEGVGGGLKRDANLAQPSLETSLKVLRGESVT